jgi:hypothetical protein
VAEVNRELYCGWANADCSTKGGDFFVPDKNSDTSNEDPGGSGNAGSSGEKESSSNSRRLLRGFGSTALSADHSSDKTAEVRSSGGGSSKEASRILTKVREGSRTLAMDSSILFQQQGLFFPSWQATTPAKSQQVCVWVRVGKCMCV